jgi:hypothetical protein
LQQRFGLMTGFGFEAAQEQPAGLAKCTLLFLQHVYAVKPGRLQIQVRRPTEDVEDDEPILATATIECTRDAFPPWMPWHQSDDELPIPRQAGFVAANRADGIALPTVMSVRAIVMAGTLDGKTIATERSQPLPELIPRKPTPGFRISEANGLLTVRSEAQFETGDPAPSFLVRWWVNDKPFIPQQVPEDRAFGYLALEGEQPVREVQWRLELDLAKLQAKNGDKVGLQLLHCDDGWEWANGGRSSIRKGWNRVVLPELSNRIEFVAK